MPGRRSRRPATVQWSARSTIPRRSGSRAISRSLVLDDPSGTVPGWVDGVARHLIRRRSAPPTSSRSTGPRATPRKVSEQDILDHGAKLIADRSGGALLVDDPGVDAAFARRKSTLERTYTTGSALHFQLEPVNALAFEKDGVFEIHTGNQWQSADPAVLAKALGRRRSASSCAPICWAAASGAG